jgi:hypothetical protein
MVTPDPIGIAVEIVPLAGGAIKKFRDKDEIRALFRETQADVRKTPLRLASRSGYRIRFPV